MVYQLIKMQKTHVHIVSMKLKIQNSVECVGHSPFRYYFYIEEDKLIVEKGVFGRSKTIVPFERIQTINFEQNLAHQVFSVLRLKVDTAGSAQKEFEFDAIAIDQAQALRKIILEKKYYQSLK